MIVKRVWVKRGRYRLVRWSGLYLFGFLPLLIWQESLDEP